MLLISLTDLGVAHATTAAEIVQLTGKGDRREGGQAEWMPAAVKQELQSGWYVRTLDMSQMGLLFADRTQIRLNQNSQLQIKSAADQVDGQTAVKLHAGRAWSQARPKVSAGDTAPPKISMETPSATLAIRGTDWEVEVGPDGRTQLVVLSGVVDMGNDHGRLRVGKGEAAMAEVGKAPVRMVLVNPRERVQWVTSWMPQPRRWAPTPTPAEDEVIALIEAGDFTTAARRLAVVIAPTVALDLLRADLLIFAGQLNDAEAVLAPHVRDGEPRSAALLARAKLLRDDAAGARRLLDAALTRQPRHVELLLARADLALFDGEEKAARAALLGVLAVEPRNPRAWRAIGRIESERENVGAARMALAESGRDAASIAEQATLETFAGNFGVAQGLFDRTLAERPDDYVALTGRGILRLKTGEPERALDDFLKAGLIEPRYARAWLWSAVSFYQLGESERAHAALARAGELDARDPLPWYMRAMARGDALDPATAMDEAREAQSRMPWLKSLNQLLNNQKGSANLGSSLAAFGMEDWARHYAVESFSPWWAGSHLFLADRYQGKFNKNSELFKGFLTDPTVFGASNRQSSLVATPGHYGSVDLNYEAKDFRQLAAAASVNGLSVATAPFAYFIGGDLATADSRIGDVDADGRNLTLGLGLKPSHALGLFAFVNDMRIDADIRDPGLSLPDDRLRQSEKRADFGANLKLSATNQLWIKAGSGSQSSQVSGAIFSPDIAASLNRAFRVTSFGDTGQLDLYRSDIEQDDAQLRHTFAVGEHGLLGWGIEHARQKKPAAMTVGWAPVQLQFVQEHTLVTDDIWFSAQFGRGSALELQADTYFQRADIRRHATSEMQIANLRVPFPSARLDENPNESNGRLGARWSPVAGHALTLVGQQWRRPASVNTLAQVDTLGIAVNDRLVSVGGKYSRSRLQYDTEFNPRTFFNAFVDRERIVNISSPATSVVADLELTQLESLRNRRDVFSARTDIEETPEFAEGRVDSWGMALNQRIGGRQALSVRYVRFDHRQTGLRSGLAIPYLPRDLLQLRSQWQLPQRWLTGIHATYRSERFKDEANAKPLNSGWAFGATAYWESADKHWVFQGILDNLRRDKQSTAEKTAVASVRLGYRF